MATNGNGTRHFTDTKATRERVPLLLGLMGCSGSGKTYSALRLATGIQRVTGGNIFVVDTESRRALHYAERFDFRHVAFGAPFSPLDYLAAIEHCQQQGASIVIVDSMSHEHEGPGGVLEMHEAEVARLSGGDSKKAERVKMLAWSRPKQERRRMINSILQLPVTSIFCFRAKEKIKIVSGKEPQPLGFMPIAGEEFLYEMALNCLLMPNSGGVPTWQSEEIGERMMIKLPEQFRTLFAERQPLSEDIGEALARWSEGGGATRYEALTSDIANAKSEENLLALWPTVTQAKKDGKVTPPEYGSLQAAFAARRKAIKEEIAAAITRDAEDDKLAPISADDPS